MLFRCIQCVFELIADDTKVAHLSTGTGLAFVVEVELDAGVSE